MNREFFSILFSNLITIAIAIAEQWTLHEVLIIFWSQSVIIGLFTVIRMIFLKEYSNSAINLTGKLADNTKHSIWPLTVFFIFHFGMFHLVYFFFMSPIDVNDSITASWIFICIGLFMISHGIETATMVLKDRRQGVNIEKIFIKPYGRIIPIHFIILAGGLLSGASTMMISAFMLLKTFADVIMQRIELKGDSVKTIQEIFKRS